MAVVEVTVVVDTNIFANGEYSSRRFKKLVKRAERKGHRLVVPRVVVWEWAEHARAAHDLYRSQARFAARRIDPLLRDAINVPPAANVEALVDTIAKDISDAGAEVVDPPDLSGLDAVRQQVLQIGHGTKRDQIKTGAADALVAATVDIVAEEQQPVVLVTGDQHLRSLVDDPPRVRVVADAHDLWSLLAVVAPAEPVVVKRFEQFVLESVRQEIAEGAYPLPSGIPRYDQHVAEALDVSNEAEVYDVTILGIDKVTADDTEVVEDDEERFLTAELTLSGTVGAFSWRLGGPDDELIHDYGEGDVQIRVTGTADLDDTFHPLSYELDGPVRLEVPEEYWDVFAGVGGVQDPT